MQTYIWHTSNPDSNSPGTIHQVLAYGNLVALKKIKQDLGEDRLREVFLKQPQKMYTASALHFITKFVLHISDTIDENRYLKHTPRSIR